MRGGASGERNGARNQRTANHQRSENVRSLKPRMGDCDTGARNTAPSQARSDQAYGLLGDHKESEAGFTTAHKRLLARQRSGGRKPVQWAECCGRREEYR